MQLFKISEMLGQQILKIGRVLGPRWAACSLRSALAVWRAYPAMYKYFSFLSFGLLPIRGRHSRYLHFYNMAFVLRLDALPDTNPLFGGKTGPPVYHIKVEASG